MTWSPTLQINVKWDDEDRSLLIYDFPESWTTEEFLHAAEQACDMIESAGHPVYVITNLRGGDRMPKGFLTSMYKLQHQIPTNQILNVVVGDTPIMQTVYNVLKMVTPRTSRAVTLAKTYEEARQQIETARNRAH